MKKFKFKLQKVLEDRYKTEDNLKKELAGLNLLKRQLEKELSNLVRMRATQHEVLREKQESGLIPTEVSFYHRFIEKLTDDIKDSKKKIQDMDQQIETKKTEVIEAMKNRKIVETLKEKQYQLFLAEMQQKEQKFIDEISTLRFTRIARAL